jgi:hypothetical protein
MGTGCRLLPILRVLLCALHKTRFAFAQATGCNTQAQAIAQKLETQVNQLNHTAALDTDDLGQWKTWIQATPATAFNYARLMRDIEDQRITLQANKANFL